MGIGKPSMSYSEQDATQDMMQGDGGRKTKSFLLFVDVY